MVKNQSFGHRRKPGFDPWPRRIPPASEHLSLCTTTMEPVLESQRPATTQPTRHNHWSPCDREPVLRKKGSHEKQTPAHHDREWPPLAACREKPTQQQRPSTAKNKWIQFILKSNNRWETESVAASSSTRGSSRPSQALEVKSLQPQRATPLELSNHNHPGKSPQVSDQQTLI